MHKAQPGWRRVCAQASLWGIPIPAFSTALAFFDGYRSEILPANILQAQRDYFGAHTFRVLPGKENAKLKANEDIREYSLIIVGHVSYRPFRRRQLDRARWQCLGLELQRVIVVRAREPVRFIGLELCFSNAIVSSVGGVCRRKEKSSRSFVPRALYYLSDAKSCCNWSASTMNTTLSLCFQVCHESRCSRLTSCVLNKVHSENNLMSAFLKARTQKMIVRSVTAGQH
jgi:hypothetical protein